MDTLIKYLFQRWKLSLFLIFGAYLPGFLYLFMMKNQLFIQLDFLKLSILALLLGLPGLLVSLSFFYIILTIISKKIKSENTFFWIVLYSIYSNWFVIGYLIVNSGNIEWEFLGKYATYLVICIVVGSVMYYFKNKKKR